MRCTAPAAPQRLHRTIVFHCILRALTFLQQLPVVAHQPCKHCPVHCPRTERTILPVRRATEPCPRTMRAQGVSLASATGRQCLLSGLRERPPRRQRRSRRAAAAPKAGFFDDIFNFESWAPKSSQAWRLGKDINSKGEAAFGEERTCEAPAAVSAGCAVATKILPSCPAAASTLCLSRPLPPNL